jgi:presenilin-like A22 family membrane protease
MKHNKRITIEMLLWTFAAILAGWWLLPIMKHSIEIPEGMNIWLVGLALTVGLVIGTFAWILILKKWRTWGVFIFGFSIGLAIIELCLRAFDMDGFVAGLIGSSAFLFYVGAVLFMRTDWKYVRRLYWVSNLLMSIAILVGAVIGAWRISPVVAMALLALAAVYDAIAVWKTGHMQDMAIKLKDDLTLPGIMVPYKQKGKVAMLGGGDIFFVVLVGGSFLKLSYTFASVVTICMASSIALLFLVSRKNKFYPALPFIFSGAVIGVVISWLIVSL